MRNNFCHATHILLLLLLQTTQAMIYLEDIEGARLYDTSAKLLLPNHFMRHDVYVSSDSASFDWPTASPVGYDAGSSSFPSTSPSFQPSDIAGSIFDRHLLSPPQPQAAATETEASISAIAPFNDLFVIYSPANYVYYDSKQAAFGDDLGPQGNFEMGNLMLPPRGVWGDDLLFDRHTVAQVVDGVLLDADVAEQVDVTDFNQTFQDSGVELNVTYNQTNMDLNASSAKSTLVADQPRRRGLRNRNIMSIDEFLGLAEPSDATETQPETLNLTDVNGTFIIQEQLSTENNTDTNSNFSSGDLSDFFGTLLNQEEQLLNAKNNTNGSDFSSTAEMQDSNSTITSTNQSADQATFYQDNNNLYSDNQVYVSDYFCLEDFVEWKTRLVKCNQQQQQNSQQEQVQGSGPFERIGINATTTEDTSTSSNIDDSDTITHPCSTNNPSTATTTNRTTTPNESQIDSLRPLTILALRGRCTFESKAQMGMLLNEIFISQGKTNRIAHIVVYNNQTGNSGSNSGSNSEDEDKLIEIGLASQTTWKDKEWAKEQQQIQERYKIGMIYINSSSGRDLIRRMMKRGNTLRLSPYLNVESLFSYDSSSKRQLDAFATVTVDQSTKGEYNNTIITTTEIQATHDPTITNGWFFPATLTRFCLSCGPERYYGFDPPSSTSFPDVLDTPNQPPWESGWFSGGWKHPPSSNVPPPTINDNTGKYNYNGSYYLPQEWVEAVRKLMISVLAVLLIGPFVFAAWRWHSVGGTVRLARDENGARRLRLIAPNMEDFVNGVQGTVERNGTKLDRAQVFALPEMEYCVGVGLDEDQDDSGVYEHGDGELAEMTANVTQENDDASLSASERGNIDPPESAALAQSPPTPSSTLGECLETGLFVSSTCCSICIEEFVHGEKLRILPRCSHAFHTECILPWLTERQGCCPLCKTPVLPDEYQRNRRARMSTSERSNSPRNRIMRSLFRQSTPLQSNGGDVGIREVDELEHDLEAAEIVDGIRDNDAIADARDNNGSAETTSTPDRVISESAEHELSQPQPVEIAAEAEYVVNDSSSQTIDYRQDR